MRRLPNESTIYLGDNARAPYGPRSDDEVNRFSAQCLDELAARDVKAIVVACNTSSAIALPNLRLRYDRPLLGVVRPGATAAALATRNRRVGVIATAGHCPFARLLPGDQGRGPVRRGRRARDAQARAARRGGPARRSARRGGRRRADRADARRSDRHRHAAARLHPLSAARSGDSAHHRQRRRRDRLGFATASALAALLEMHSLARAGRCAADSRPADDGRRRRRSRASPVDCSSRPSRTSST